MATLSIFEPAEFVQVMIYIFVPISTVIFVDPPVFCVPDQFPDATHEVALDELQDKVTDFPLTIVNGPSELFAFILTFGKSTHDSFNRGSPDVEPQPFQSTQVLV